MYFGRGLILRTVGPDVDAHVGDAINEGRIRL